MCYPNDTTIRHHLSSLVFPISREYSDEHRSLKLEEFATAVHSGAATLHFIGIGYHLYENKVKYSLCHALAASFNIASAYQHYKHKKFLIEDQGNNE